MSVIVRAAHPEGAAALVPAVRAAVRAVDPDQPVFDETTVDALLRERTAGRRFLLTVVAAFTGVALALAAVGLYGVMAYAVAQRRRDFGVRLALGAAPARLRRAVLGRGMALASAGVAAGTALSLAASRLLGGLLYDVRPGDPAVLAGVAAVLLAVAAAAAWWPARRAAAVPPHELLRGE
jgi:ABC-type antimicrobial peptide transport system permease subunit